MKKERILISLIRYVLGAIFVVFGLNGFLSFFETPAPQGAAGQFMTGLTQSGFFWPLEKGVEVVAGLMLLARVWVPFALVLLAPIITTIFCYHVFLAPSGLLFAIALTLFEVSLVVAYWENFRSLFTDNEIKGTNKTRSIEDAGLESQNQRRVRMVR